VDIKVTNTNLEQDFILVDTIWHNIKIGKQQIEQVETFKYLGVQINQEGRIDKEINTRITSSSKLFNAIKSGFLSHREITEKTKLSVYKSTFSPILSFASET
jgi:hypothetical protein